MEAVAICQQLQDIDGAVRRARMAVERAPNLYNIRKILGQQLVAAKQYDEASEHLGWCIRRRPSDEQAKELLKAVRSMRRHQQGLPVQAASHSTDARG